MGDRATHYSVPVVRGTATLPAVRNVRNGAPVSERYTHALLLIVYGMTAKLTAGFVKHALEETVWDFGNQVLYDLCRVNPNHKRKDIILAKILLIGRSYAASIERRPDKGDIASGDLFYETKVGPRILRSPIDTWFRKLANGPYLDSAIVLETHGRVTNLFAEISGLEKRSLASKYLHFHFPELFYLYDSRASRAISGLTSSVKKHRLASLGEYDLTYARFFLRCRDLNKELDSLVGRHLKPRDVDKVLLAWYRKHLRHTAMAEQKKTDN